MSDEESKAQQDADAETRDVCASMARDDIAFARLYQRHAPHVYALCRWLGDAGDEEDALQDVFLLVWRELPGLREPAYFRGWLRRLSTNVLLRRRRERRRATRVIVHGDVPDLSLVGGIAPEARISLADAIALLPAFARDVFVLHDVEGFTHEEIAQHLEIAPGTSASRLSRARAMLRARLGDRFDPGAD